MKYCENWNAARQRFDAWWKREKTDRPLMRVISPKEGQLEPLEELTVPADPEEIHLGAAYQVAKCRNYCKTYDFLAEAFPSVSLNMGAGSMAFYLGCTPTFSKDTVWFNECVPNGWQEFGNLIYDPDNFWWKKHQQVIKEAKALSRDEFLICIPDIVENIDILSAMRGPQDTCFDLIDFPETMHDYLNQVDSLYFNYYNALYDLVKLEDNSSSYTAFEIWGYGKTAKVQCDFSAMMSPVQFQDFIVPSLRKQCKQLDHSMYHLDGRDAIRHVDALMEIDELDALQWTPGAGQPDGGCELWYPLYDKVVNAEKGLWIALGGKDITECAGKAKKIVKRYGSTGLYFHFSSMLKTDALQLINESYSWATL